MQAIDFVVRTGAGGVERGLVSADGSVTPIAAGAGQEISLNLRQGDIRGYQRLGSNLEITLTDGRVIILEDFFASAGESRLFISADGYLNEVELAEGQDGAVFAQYGVSEQWGKWSPSDDLIFLEGTEVARVPVAVDEEEVTMLGAGLLGASGLWGAGAAAAAAVGGASLIGGGNGSATPTRIEPSIDQDQQIVIAGDGTTEDDQSILISGRAEPGSEVEVTVGPNSQTVIAGDDGTWEATFEGDDFPGDGTHPVRAVVTEPSGIVTELDGPSVMIDLTGPEINFTDGTQSIGDLTNADDFADGVEIEGTGEAGASIEVTIDGVTHTTTVDDDGTWAVRFLNTELQAGEYETTVTVVSIDINGNSTTVTDTLVVDTVPHPIVINESTIEGDGVVNAEEASNGITITGTSTPGAVIEVTVEGNGTSVTRLVTVDANGDWTLDLAPGEMPGGEYEATITTTTTDAAGNASSETGTMWIDTIGEVAFDSGAIHGDNIVSSDEMSSGVTLTGTTQPGSTVEVSYTQPGGTVVTHTATVDASGNWAVDFNSGDFPGGTYDAEFTVTAVDAAGNSATDTRMLQIDTEANVTIDTGLTGGGDDLINSDDANSGVTLTGTTEPDNTVEVTMGSYTRTATVDVNGNWSVDFPSSEMPTGEGDVEITAVASDAAGNSSSTTTQMDVDTLNSVTVNTHIEGDGVVNEEEHSDGITLTGLTQPGSTVEVTIGNVTRSATVDASGNWSADFLAVDIPTGDTQPSVTVVSTDANDNVATTTGTIDVDTVVENFNMVNNAGGGDGILSGSESDLGLTLTGTTEVGSVVSVRLGSIEHPASVDANGNWTVTFAAHEIPEANDELIDLVATARDQAGNVDTVTDTVRIDNVAGSLTLSSDPVAGDNIINYDEANAGVTFHGTSDPGNVVQVSFGSGSHTVITDSFGNWQATFASHEIPTGTSPGETVTATTIDAAGNSREVSGTVNVDRVVDNLGFTTATVAGDNIINHDERMQGVEITGTVESGSSIEVLIDGIAVSASVDASGNWTALIPASVIPTGHDQIDMVVNVQDPAGNTASIQRTIEVDTVVRNLAHDTAPIEGDNVVNASEARDGFTLNGTVEAGSVVEVEFNNQTYTASVDASGNWTVDIPASGIPVGNDVYDAVITATDAARNVDTITQQIAIDTEVPDGPIIANYTRGLSGYSAISVDMSDDDLAVYQVDGATGNVNQIAEDSDGVDISILGTTTFGFDPAVPDGSHLVVTSTDDAGNSSGTYLVLDDTSTSVVDMSNSNLGNMQIEAIDLQFAEDSQLTITEAQLTNLSTNSDSVVIHGGHDDTVTITGAVRTGQSVDVDGQRHDIYTLGNDGTVIIDDDIHVVI
ncbi:MAG: hypothetical protein CSA70_10300 [Rhodobacterales bacterium]|nr:MAG: hypothetical protein CSA70_10300 [Rhodobacterales bacterium]